MNLGSGFCHFPYFFANYYFTLTPFFYTKKSRTFHPQFLWDFLNSPKFNLNRFKKGLKFIRVNFAFFVFKTALHKLFKFMMKFSFLFFHRYIFYACNRLPGILYRTAKESALIDTMVAGRADIEDFKTHGRTVTKLFSDITGMPQDSVYIKYGEMPHCGVGGELK